MSTPEMSEGCRSNVSPGDGAEQSSTVPRRPHRSSRHCRHASDQTVADDLPKISNERTPVKAVTDRLENVSNNDSTSAESGRSLKALAGEGVKTFASPITASPANTGVLAPTNTRRIGSKFCIDLVKGWLLWTCGIKS